jgi:hypothetical protein
MTFQWKTVLIQFSNRHRPSVIIMSSPVTPHQDIREWNHIPNNHYLIVKDQVLPRKDQDLIPGDHNLNLGSQDLDLDHHVLVLKNQGLALEDQDLDPKDRNHIQRHQTPDLRDQSQNPEGLNQNLGNLKGQGHDQSLMNSKQHQIQLMRMVLIPIVGVCQKMICRKKAKTSLIKIQLLQ